MMHGMMRGISRMQSNSWRGYNGCSFMGSTMHGGWGYLIMFAIIAAIGLVVFLGMRKNNSGNNNKYNDHDKHESQALNTLKDLYARGEISEEEYFTRKNVIEQG